MKIVSIVGKIAAKKIEINVIIWKELLISLSLTEIVLSSTSISYR